MAKVRPITPEEAVFRVGSGYGDSRAKAGVWFSEKVKFKANQKLILDALKDELDWVPLSGAIMIVNQKTPGIVIVAPNPSLPGIIALANGVTDSGTEKLQKSIEATLRRLAEQEAVATVKIKKPAK